MFHFGTDHTNQERRDGFVSFRCFLWLGGRGGERTGTGIGEEGRGLGEDGRGWRGRERDFERKKQGLGTGQNNDSEKGENGTFRGRKKGIGNHVIL